MHTKQITTIKAVSKDDDLTPTPNNRLTTNKLKTKCMAQNAATKIVATSSAVPLLGVRRASK